MTDQVDNEAPNPYEVRPESDPIESSTDVRLWTIPAIVVLAIVWFLLVVPGKIAPLTLLHFASMQLAGVIGVIGLTIWWILSKGVPAGTRIKGYLLILAITVTGIFLGHPSTRLTMFIYGLPIAFSIVIGALFLFRNQPWRKRGLIAIVAYTCFMIASLFVRLTDQDAAFGFKIAPRWQQSAEEKFIASMRTQRTGQDEDASTDSKLTSTEATEVSLPSELTENDWAEFRGPKRDGIATFASINTDWEQNPPQEIWRRPVGPAWSSLCVVGDTIFTQEQRDDEEAVVAYSAINGDEIWVHSYPGRFEASMGGVGPRATPTYVDGKLYTTGANGRVDCLDPTEGGVIWTFDAMEDRETPVMAWGYAASPLVHDGSVYIVQSDGEDRGALALDAQSGELVWMAGRGTHTYSSCQLETIDGVPQILVVSNWGIQSLQPKSGELIWEHAWDIGTMARVTQPIVIGNSIYITTGYGNGTQRIDVSKAEKDGESKEWEIEEAWTTNLLKPYFNDAVYFEGNLYGFDGPIMVCMDAETGDKQWKGGRYGHGQVLLVPNPKVLLVVTEKGKLVLLEANPDKRVEIAELQSVEGVTWNHPVIAGKRLFVRNAQEMVCYELAD